MTREKAIKIIKEFINGTCLHLVDQEALKTLIPELKESEDERIRRELIEFIQWSEDRGMTRHDFHQAKRPSEWIAYLEKQKVKEKQDRMMPIYNDRDSFESALDKAWKSYNECGSRTVDSFEDDYIECVHAKGFREGYLFGLEKQKEKAVDKEGMYYYLGGKFIYCGYPATEENPYDFAMSQQEKQKEQSITANDLDEEIHRFFDDCIDVHEAKLYGNISERVIPVDCYELTARHFAKWSEKQKEQIPYTDFVIKPHKGDDNNPYDMQVSEAQEYAIKRGFGIPYNDGEVYVDERHMTQTIGNILRWADEHPKEQEPVDYEAELKKCKDNPLYFYDKHVSIKQKLAEWRHYIWATNLRFDFTALIKYDNTDNYEIVQAGNRPKQEKNGVYILIKDIKLQSHWKPSEEQMEALLNALHPDDSYYPELKSLYEQLKKLM